MLLNRLLSFRRLVLAAAGLVAALPALALPAVALGGNGIAQSGGGDCYSIGLQVAADNGGTLAKASATTQDGQTVCIIVVLVPGKEGQRPRRAEFVVAAQ